MSAAYPEGECFFKRSALKTSTYDADKPEHFYAHMMVEYIRNKPAFHGSYESDYDKDRHFHLRSNYEVVKGDWWNTVYGNWTNISFLYGKKPYHDQYRHAVHDLCTNGNSFRDQEKGASLESWFMMIPMPMLATGEDWVLIDVSFLSMSYMEWKTLIDSLNSAWHISVDYIFLSHIRHLKIIPKRAHSFK
jgi:hypothetical protein